MRNVLAFLAAASLVACSSSGSSSTTTEGTTSAKANPCATPGASYRTHTVEQSGGTCGGVADEFFKIDADGTSRGPGYSCEVITRTGCSAHATNCVTSASSPCKVERSITFTDDGSSASAVQTVTCSASSTSPACASTYDVTVKRE